MPGPATLNPCRGTPACVLCRLGRQGEAGHDIYLSLFLDNFYIYGVAAVLSPLDGGAGQAARLEAVAVLCRKKPAPLPNPTPHLHVRCAGRLVPRRAVRVQ